MAGPSLRKRHKPFAPVQLLALRLLPAGIKINRKKEAAVVVATK